MHGSGEAITLDKLAPFLEGANAGSRKLDTIVAYVLAGMSAETRRRVELLLDGQFSWDVVSDLFPDEAPAYTTSLDAAAPGENVVFVMYEAERHRWVAIHRTAEGEEIVARGATEALARRGAGLKALAAVARRPAAAVPVTPDLMPVAESAPLAEPALAPPEEQATELVGGVVAEIAVEPQPAAAPDAPAVAVGGLEAGDGAPEPADDGWQIRF